MCGIVGVVGKQPCIEILLDGLRRLEYRGYDSAGVATISGGEFTILRSAGKLSRLASLVAQKAPEGTVGIGHTRWATHGRPSEANAHPHRFRDTVVVHNGIIENYAALKRELQAQGHEFTSETDSEIIAHLVQRAMEREGDLVRAVRDALLELHGSFAVAVLDLRAPDRMVAARRMSPLVIGLGDGESYLASDVPALLQVTRRFQFLEDGDLALLTREGVSIHSVETMEAVSREVRTVSWTPAMAEKGGYKHFMLKEIHEQPRSVSDTLRPRLGLTRGEVVLDELGPVEQRLQALTRVTLLACGTSFHAGLVGRMLIEDLARLPCDVEVASEFRYRNPLVGSSHLVVAISQSGETADTIAAVQEARSKGATILSVCNVVDSTLARMADAVLYTYAGPEIGVASTKAFTCQMAVLALLAVWLGRRLGRLDADRAATLVQGLTELPVQMEKVLERNPHILEVARKHQRVRSMLYLGRNVSHPIALEGALKLKELSYVHAEGYPAGEMKHGPIALVDDSVPSLFVVPNGPTWEKTLSNMEEIRSRSGPVIAVLTEGNRQVADLAGDRFEIPSCLPELSPFLTVLPLQLFAYHVADLKGTDVDQPRNLAKSVTVE
ncbi:MAG: glutamine--fructose-6-phosphate transaminase (isomerizing) [Deltaproteobacteria bacterium]|nr:glutamine--fructose-6-phosphate transaminase (isomerizing) [Deltaproteobacteria bacterium]